MRPAIILALVYAIICCAPAAAADRAATGGSRLSPGDGIEYFGLKPLLNIDGKSQYLNIGDLTGPNAKTPKKLLLISFFASWCEACKVELPQIEKHFRIYRDQGMASVFVCIDKEKEAADKAREFVRLQGFTSEVLHDPYNIVARRYFKDDFTLPSTYLVGADGKISAVFSGGGAENLQSIEKELSALFSSISKPDAQNGAKSADNTKER